MDLKIQDYDYIPLHPVYTDDNETLISREGSIRSTKSLKRSETPRPLVVHTIGRIGFLEVAPAAISGLFCLFFIAAVTTYLALFHITTGEPWQWIVILESRPRLLLMSSVGSNLIGFAVSGLRFSVLKDQILNLLQTSPLMAIFAFRLVDEWLRKHSQSATPLQYGLLFNICAISSLKSAINPFATSSARGEPQPRQFSVKPYGCLYFSWLLRGSLLSRISFFIIIQYRGPLSHGP